MDKNKLIGRIKKGGFLGNKKISDNEFNIHDNMFVEILKEALYLGYMDVCRTIDISDKGVKAKNVITDEKIYSCLQGYFKGKIKDKDSFDSFHRCFCKCIIDIFKEKTGYELRYGQVQKIVNMTFKYLYLCKNVEKYRDYFRWCHMPLDKYTLLWVGSITGVYFISWSNMKWELYNCIQKRIRDEITDDKMVLEEEFRLWAVFSKCEFDLSKDDDQQEIIQQIMKHNDI